MWVNVSFTNIPTQEIYFLKILYLKQQFPWKDVALLLHVCKMALIKY